MTAEVRGADKMVSKDREYNEDRSSPGGMTEELLTSRLTLNSVLIVIIIHGYIFLMRPSNSLPEQA